MYRIMRVLHFSLSLTIMIFKIMMGITVQENNKDMCKMTRGGGHLNMSLISNNARSCKMTMTPLLTLTKKNVDEREQHGRNLTLILAIRNHNI
jgi:hypothetical protein